MFLYNTEIDMTVSIGISVSISIGVGISICRSVNGPLPFSLPGHRLQLLGYNPPLSCSGLPRFVPLRLAEHLVWRKGWM